MRIGVDPLGSESSPKIFFEAVLLTVEQMDASDSIVVYVTQESLEQLLCDGPGDFSTETGAAEVDLHIVKEFITMEDEPLSAVRLKRDSSLVVGIRQLREGKIDAFVTAGNTGALMASATILLPKFTGIERPALLAVLPTQSKPCAMIDVGGMVSCTAAQLVQYAQMGAAFQRFQFGVEVPTIGLLNIGEESGKGKVEVREAYQWLHKQSMSPNTKMRFLGNVEGREVFQGKVDVLVTDGFTGNIMLKTSEGISSFIFDYFQEALKDTSSSEIHGVLDEIQRHFSYDEYPGAAVCGVDGIVVKCHGATSKKGVINSVKGAMDLVNIEFRKKLKEEFFYL